LVDSTVLIGPDGNAAFLSYARHFEPAIVHFHETLRKALAGAS
jgi:hypothetical protein